MMWMPRIRLLALAVGFAVSVPAAGAEPPAPEAPATAGSAPAAHASCAEAIARKVQAHYDGVQDLSARFTQTSRVASLGDAPEQGDMQASGKVVFAKPGRMRWSYEKPQPSLVVTDGKTLWTWDPGLGEAQHLAVGKGFLSGTAIQFLLGEGDVLQTFAVDADRCDGDRVVLRLQPYKAASYERLLLEVDPRTGEVHATEVVDLLGNTTRVAFSHVRTNTRPAADTFHFKPPKGAQVIEVPPAP